MLSRNKKLFIANFAFAGYEGPGVILLYNGALSARNEFDCFLKIRNILLSHPVDPFIVFP